MKWTKHRNCRYHVGMVAFQFTKSFYSSAGILAWMSVCASPRCGNRWFRNARKKTNNPNPSPIGNKFGLYWFGAADGTWTHTLAHTPLKRACLPIPALPHLMEQNAPWGKSRGTTTRSRMILYHSKMVMSTKSTKNSYICSNFKGHAPNSFFPHKMKRA